MTGSQKGRAAAGTRGDVQSATFGAIASHLKIEHFPKTTAWLEDHKDWHWP
jgi:hypothetical protein